MPAIATPTEGVERVIHPSAAKTWLVLTTPASLKQFCFAADAVTEWKVCAPIRTKGEFKGKTYEDRGNTIAFEPQTLLSFSHWNAVFGKADTPETYHVVSFDLVPSGAGTKVTPPQPHLAWGVTATDIEHSAEYEKNWSSVLEVLANILPYREPLRTHGAAAVERCAVPQNT